MPPSPSALDAILSGLVEGAARHARRDAESRSTLAIESARSVAAAAESWVQAALELKHGGDAERGEEWATGPLVNLRLLLITARAIADTARVGRPRAAAGPRMSPNSAGTDSQPFVEVDVLPWRPLRDGVIFRGHRVTVRCVNPGGIETFERIWRLEAEQRPRSGGVAVVLGPGNVTGLAVGDAICQIFEHGRGVLLKLHPLHAPLETVLGAALRPLIEAGLLAIVTGAADVAEAAVARPAVTHVHLTGGHAAFESLVWAGRDPRGAGATPALAKPITCELGNVTPWIVVPGRYTAGQLACQADMVAASIINNTSFNCIATKLVITCRGWSQREEFLSLVARRLDRQPRRPAWYPGSIATWENATGRKAPADGTLPWSFLPGVDVARERRLVEREWFVPVALEAPLDAADIEAFCTQAIATLHALPGSLAANITVPVGLPARDAQRVELLVGHLEYGVVGVNGWSALAYKLANAPWGGFPGSTLSAPRSGIGRVHDPLLLPLVHNTIVRMPLEARPAPPWFPWHPRGGRLAEGLFAMYAAIARGGSGMGPLLRMFPDVLASLVAPRRRP